jgi:hypothetical protein
MIANTASNIETITTPEELIPWLFEELLTASPCQPVQPSLILAVGGARHGIIFGGLSGRYCELLEVLADYWRSDESTDCGLALIKFANMLWAETFNLNRVVDPDRLMELMVLALGDDGLRVVSKGKRPRVVSSSVFSKQHEKRIDVRFGQID